MATIREYGYRWLGIICIHLSKHIFSSHPTITWLQLCPCKCMNAKLFSQLGLGSITLTNGNNHNFLEWPIHLVCYVDTLQNLFSTLNYFRTVSLWKYSKIKSIIIIYCMAFQNSLFWLVDKRSVKTHIRTVVRIIRIWTGVPDVVYLSGIFCFANWKKFCFLNFQLCFTDKSFKQPNCFWLSMYAYRILLPMQWNWR
jgi:hypothetical protein